MFTSPAMGSEVTCRSKVKYDMWIEVDRAAGSSSAGNILSTLIAIGALEVGTRAATDTVKIQTRRM